MKKLIVIIIILAIIYIGMVVYKNTAINANQISIGEIKNIEEYINKIYMWKEVTGEALPNFDTIEQADEDWIWEVVKKNIEDEAPTYEQIEEKAKDIFGQAFSKPFKEEGTESIVYNSQTENYNLVQVELDEQIDMFLLNKIEKIEQGYEVEIIEYLEDNSQLFIGNSENFVIIKNTNDEEIGRVSGTIEGEATELVKRNIEKFTKKKIKLKKENEKLYVEKIYN